ncbi:MAG: hypothetical protein J0I06_20895 [Planctomycetes bacterium]|nr:hypothetical protein [Planctomycetota bacterium]
MRRRGWAFVCVLMVAVPTIGLGEKPPPFGGPGPIFFEDGSRPAIDANYKAPKADGPVVELLDEGTDPLFPVLINDGGGEAGTITREDRDVFSGVEAVRVTPMQKYRSRIPGWNFKIVENPKAPAGPKVVPEFRYLRFAWKKIGGNGVMIQLHDPVKSWAFRYHAGANVQGWQPSKQIAEGPPTGWEVVTRDLFKDFGEFSITGMALSPLDGTAALFDHILLGRTVEDLDRATDAALGRVKPAKAPSGKERETLWADLIGPDRVKAAAAQRTFLATAAEHVGFMGEQLARTATDKEQLARVQQFLKELDADAFDVRDRATDELVKLGALAVDGVQALASNAPNDEVRYRARLILRKLNGDGQPVSAAGRTARVVRVLERAGTSEARVLLGKLADGEFGPDVAPDARAALARLKAKP